MVSILNEPDLVKAAATLMLAASDLQTRLPLALRLLCQPVADYTNRLHPAELKLIRVASTSRKQEFSTGRFLARRLLGTLGAEHGPLLRGPNREPLWPPGTVGSISHSLGFCAVAAGSADHFLGIGLDLQAEHPNANLASLILSDEESRSRDSLGELRLRFSLKEAVFKCVFPLVGVHVGFRDLTIALDRERSTFTAACETQTSGWSQPLRLAEGCYSERSEGVMGVFWVPHSTN